jgi:hypothetical protein
MPGLNQKGPMGEGAMTGRRMGKCTNFGAKAKNVEQPNVVPESENYQNTVAFDQSAGMGFGRGRRGLVRGSGRGQNGNGMGMGRRRRNGFGNGNN